MPNRSPRDACYVRRALGEPYYETDGVLLYRGDCVDLLDALPHEGVDLTVTSPPYNLDKEYEQRRSLREYLDWCARWMAAVHEATHPAGAFWLNLGYVSISGRGKAVPLPYLLWDASRFFLVQEVVWHYGAGVAARRSLSPRNEKLLWYVKDPACYTFNLDGIRDLDVKYPQQRRRGKLRCNPLGKNPTDVWSIPKVTSGAGRSSSERTPHPAQSPEAVIDRIVKASSDPGDIVLDPFVGSGTTAVVARRLGRVAVGFETRDDYLDIAARRIERSLGRGAAEAPT